jgi:histidine decarboxylase
MPFIEMAHAEGRIDRRGPIFDFRLPFVQSVAMSGHKWIGAPWPCGIYMTKVKYQIRPPDDPAYIVGSPDTTFAGSRNGFSAMILWDFLARHSHAAQVERALETEAMAGYIEARLRELEQRLGVDLWIARTELSLTVRFKAASPALIYKYSLSGEELSVNGQARQYSHVYAMPHVTRETVDALIADLAQPGAFPDQAPAPAPAPGPAKRIPTGARPLVHVPTSGRGFQ